MKKDKLLNHNQILNQILNDIESYIKLLQNSNNKIENNTQDKSTIESKINSLNSLLALKEKELDTIITKKCLKDKFEISRYRGGRYWLNTVISIMFGMVLALYAIFLGMKFLYQTIGI